MKSLHDLVYEKLIINNTAKIKSKENINEIDPAVKNRIENLMYEKSPSASHKHMIKMEGYMKKGSKPKILVNTIKDLTKLINRWYCGIQLDWNEAIKTFGDAIIARTDLTLDNLHAFILDKYKKSSNLSASKEHFKNYLDLYNINY